MYLLMALSRPLKELVKVLINLLFMPEVRNLRCMTDVMTRDLPCIIVSNQPQAGIR